MESIKFTHDQKDFTINFPELGIGNWPNVIVDKKNGPLLVYQMTSVYINLGKLLVKVNYTEMVTDQNGELVPNQSLKLEPFDATTQESFSYFYVPSRNGAEMTKMIIDGFLYAKFGFFVFGPSLEFMPPIWFSHAVEQLPLVEATPEINEIRTRQVETTDQEGNPILVQEEYEYHEPSTCETQKYRLTVNVEDGAGDTYTYQVKGIPAQENNVFENLEKGNYEIIVTSKLSMPCTRTLVI